MEPSTTSAPPPLFGTRALAHDPPIEAEKAQATVAELAAAPSAEKKAVAVDHMLVMSEVQLLLAEKRTSFALMRTGVAIALVPLSLVSVLIATSALWNAWDVAWLIIPLAVVFAALLLLGGYLIVHALEHLAHVDRVLLGLRASDTLLEDLLIKHGRGSDVVKPWNWMLHKRG